MNRNFDYYIVDKRVMPDVFVKVVEAKELLDKGMVMSVQEAVDKAGVSRSAYYKYKDYVSVLGNDTRGKIVILAFNLEDKAGILSLVLNILADHGANLLTINQTIPVSNVANVTITIDTGNMTAEIKDLLESIGRIHGVLNIKIIARE
ncbi:MAG: ACT domain-containing protein [Clostridia bacterium]|nr:ACT domain-containing protein [Clostridia bacterium]